ncbi:hypothetical protein R3P38DRAFT_3341000 [Favolaschia claudopus]|uniref:Uncharacterized protein n=1 Tax=Favolaschia claudopus TaxID=2862362 RepID=A0AAW0EFG9_9AGAR
MLSIMSSAFGVNNASAITGTRTRIPQLPKASVPPRNVLGLSEAAWRERFRSSRPSLPKTETSTALTLVHKPSVGNRTCFKPAQPSFAGAGFLITRPEFRRSSVGSGRVERQGAATAQPVRALKSRFLSIIRIRSAAHAPSITTTRSDFASIVTCAQFDIQPFVVCVFIKNPVAIPECQCAQVTVAIEQNSNQKEEQIVVEDPVDEKNSVPRRPSYIWLLRSVAAAAALRKPQSKGVEECHAKVEEVEAVRCEEAGVFECDEGAEIRGGLDGVAHFEQNCVQKEEQIVVEHHVDEHSVPRRPSHISLLRSVAAAAASRKLQKFHVEEVEADWCEGVGVSECHEGAEASSSMDGVAQETSEDEDDSDDADIDPPPYEEFLEGIPPDPLFQKHNANEHVIHRPPLLESIALQMAAKPHPARGSHLHLLMRLRTCISVAEEVKTQHDDDHLPSYNESIENIPPRPLSSKKTMLLLSSACVLSIYHFASGNSYFATGFSVVPSSTLTYNRLVAGPGTPGPPTEQLLLASSLLLAVDARRLALVTHGVEASEGGKADGGGNGNERVWGGGLGWYWCCRRRETGRVV